MFPGYPPASGPAISASAESSWASRRREPPARHLPLKASPQMGHHRCRYLGETDMQCRLIEEGLPLLTERGAG
jgi:hypothetical protein